MPDLRRRSIPPREFGRSCKAFARFCRRCEARQQPLKIWLAGLEWSSNWIARYVSSLRMTAALEYIAKLSLLGALLAFLIEYPTRRKLERERAEAAKAAAKDARTSRHYVAWQTINSAVGKPGNAGRADALYDLNSGGISLAYVDISGQAVFPPFFTLTNAELRGADLTGALFQKPNLSGANLREAKLGDIRVTFGDLSGTDMSLTEVTNARFFGCDFSSAQLRPLRFENTEFVYCNFYRAVIGSVAEIRRYTMESPIVMKGVFTNVVFKNCNFVESDMASLWFRYPTAFVGCNIYKISNAPPTVLVRSNASIAFTNFLDWVDWLNIHRPTLSGFNTNYADRYTQEVQRVKQNWPRRK